MRNLLRPLFVVTLVLLIPIIPFVIFGQRFESWVTERFDEQTTRNATAAWVVGLLATDIFLPIPSSLVSTMGGARLGWLAGTGASWLGMSIGALLGFAVARRWGRAIALWFANESDLVRMQQAVQSWGILVLILSRALPIVAEASVLLFGLNRMPWLKFLPAVLLSNFGIALAYSAFGDWAQQHAWLPVALGASGVIPFLVAAAVRHWYSRTSNHHRTDQTDQSDRTDR